MLTLLHNEMPPPINNECSITEKVLPLCVTSGNALMVQVNSGVITGVTVVNGRVEGEQQRRYRGGCESWRTEKAGGENVPRKNEGWGEGEGDNSGDGGTWWELGKSLSEPLNVLHC